MIVKYIKDKFYQIASAEKSVKKITLSFCLGNFIAWLPIIPFQTPIIFAFAWLFSLNGAVAFIAACLVNNPITMVPLYILDYLVGLWFFEFFLKIDLSCYNPSWLISFSNRMQQYVDFKKYIGDHPFCLWYLILGGVIISFITSIILYPIIKYTLKKITDKIEKQNIK